MMKKNGKQVLFLGGIFIIAFAIWTALIQMVDVQPLGQNATNIGFATFNCWFHRLTNVNMTIYTINHQTRGLCQRNPGFPDKKRKRNFGISASPPWQTGKPGRIDRACLGCLRGQLQRIHPRPYVFASAKAQGGTWIRSDFE